MEEVTYRKRGDHYEVLVGGKFYCSADSIKEVFEEITRINEKEIFDYYGLR